MTVPAGQAQGVFISYRRQDAAFPAGWLYEQLGSHFGHSHVFKDVDSIRPGDDFVKVITEAVKSCHTVLVVIGPTWLATTGDPAQRRINAPNDIVRIEIETALQSGAAIIPVLVLGASMPPPTELPPSIAALAGRNALEITPTHFMNDVEHLIRNIERIRREADEQAHREAEGQTRREAEEQARREAEDRRRREADEQARRDAEERTRREAEEQADRDAEERTRRELEKPASTPVATVRSAPAGTPVPDRGTRGDASPPTTRGAVPPAGTDEPASADRFFGRKRGLLVGLAIAAVVLIVVVINAVPGTQSGGNTNGGSPPPTTGKAQRYTVAMITYEVPGDTFWDKVRNGALAAAGQHGITLKYANNPDPDAQATLVQNAIDAKVDAIAVTLPGSDVVASAVKRAADGGIPVVAFHGRLDQYRQAGAEAYFGIDDEAAGQTIGQRIASEQGREAVCIVPAAGVVQLESRCNGVREAFPQSKNLQVNGADPASVQQTITSYLQAYPSVSHIVTLTPSTAISAVGAKQATGSAVTISAFGLNTDIGKAIQNGDIEFAYDEMPYEQGSQAVTALWNQLANGIALSSAQFSGPSIVDMSNIAQVLPGIENNTR